MHTSQNLFYARTGDFPVAIIAAVALIFVIPCLLAKHIL